MHLSARAPHPEEKAISRETILSLYVPAIMLSLGTGIAAPVLPVYARSFEVSFATASLIVILHQFGALFSTFPTGYLIDRIGRRPVALMGPLITAMTAFATAFAPSFEVLLAIRFVNGGAQQMWQQARLAMIADAGGARERGKLITWMMSFTRFGMLFSPVIGGFLGGVDLRLPFIVHGILVLIAWVPSFKLIKETRPPVMVREDGKKAGDGDWAFIRSELFKPQMLWFITAQVFANLTRGNIQGILNLYVAFTYNVSTQTLGLMGAANSALNLPTGFLTGTIMDRYGRKKTIVPGFFGLFLSSIFLAWTALTGASFALFLVGYFAIHMSQGVTSGNMQVLGSDLAPERARGRFIGIWRTLAEVGNATSPLVFTALTAVSYAASFSFVAICALVVVYAIGAKVPETVRSRSSGRGRGRREAAEAPPEPPPTEVAANGSTAPPGAAEEEKAAPRP